MTDELRETIREKLAAGILRREAPSRVWHGFGTDHLTTPASRRQPRHAFLPLILFHHATRSAGAGAGLPGGVPPT